MISNAMTLSVVVFQEDGWLCARFLEYDMAVQAKSLPELHYEAQRLLMAHIAMAAELNQEPFAGLKPAPQKFWSMFESAPISASAIRSPFRLPHPGSFPQIIPEYRVAS